MLLLAGLLGNLNDFPHVVECSMVMLQLFFVRSYHFGESLHLEEPIVEVQIADIHGVSQ